MHQLSHLFKKSAALIVNVIHRAEIINIYGAIMTGKKVRRNQVSFYFSFLPLKLVLKEMRKKS